MSIGPGSLVEVDGQLGDFVLIARNVQIVGRNDHSIDEIGVPIVRGLWVGDRPQSEADTVLIERDVWVGAAAIILGGVTIGEGSVVGAGSVVTRDVPPYTIVAGVPASAVGKRFESEDERRRHSEALDALSIKSPKKQSSESEPRV
ncbi:DapH/DapD/GlmU-related protein [Paenarthrobacter sp. C1]|uniref:DapH/DapD/GlmU-related protein n=1 Tax=Paenarthrobacter sp. C1 TaxID=3400220 RepID=UPI003BF50BA9